MTLWIDGADSKDRENNILTGDGKFAPFYVFDTLAQDWIGPPFRFRWMAVLYRRWLRFHGHPDHD